MKYLILSKKQWNKKNYNFLNKKFKFFSSIKINEIKKISPEIIFFIHWSEKFHQKFSISICVFNFIHQIYLNLKEAPLFKIKL